MALVWMFIAKNRLCSITTTLVHNASLDSVWVLKVNAMMKTVSK